MTEVRFYHLTERPLEAVLPVMLERSLERGWRVLLRSTVAERIEALDRHLWTYRDESFLPHGRAGMGAEADQPILLTTEGGDGGGAEDGHGAEDGAENAANTLFLVDGAESPGEEMAAMEMVAILFDGGDPAAVEHARGQWRKVTGAGMTAVYWAQENGGWVKKAEA